MGVNAVWLLTRILLLLRLSNVSAFTSRRSSLQFRGTSVQQQASPNVAHPVVEDEDVESDDTGVDDDDDDDNEDHGDASNVHAKEEAELLQALETSKAALDENHQKQAAITKKIDDISDAVGAESEIPGHVKAVTHETDAAALGNFLGNMWQEMRMLKTPIYKEHLEQRLKFLRREEAGLRERYDANLEKMKRREQVLGNKEKVKELQEGQQEEQKEEQKEEEVREKRSKENADAEEGDEVREEHSKENEDVEEGDEATDWTGKPPWMRGKKPEVEEDKPSKQEAPEDRTRKPEWLKALDNTQNGKERSTETEDKTTHAEAKGKSVKPESVKAAKDPEKQNANVATKSRAVKKIGPMFTEKTMPDVSPTVYCIILLAWVYFIVYSAMAILSSINLLSDNAFAFCVRLWQMLDLVKIYVAYAPMLSILFLATRLRAIQLSEGDTEKHKLPQPWVQAAMYAASYGVVFQVSFAFVRFGLLHRIDANGRIEPNIRAPKWTSTIFAVVECICCLCVYGGFTAVCIGAIFMPAPKELWGADTPPVWAVLICTVTLSCLYFFIYLVLGIFRAVEERWAISDRLVKVKLLFWRSTSALDLVPMLCVLFLLTRMHALQKDPKNGNPPAWAQACAYVCVGAVLLQVTSSIVLPLVDKDAYIKEPGNRPVKGQIILVISNPKLKVISSFLRFVPLLCIYGGSFALLVSLLLDEAYLKCVTALTTLYFAVLTSVYVAQSITEVLEKSSASYVVSVLDAAQRTVMFAPMLCLIFMAARMRATQLSRMADGTMPPGVAAQTWVQNAMYFSTLSMILQVFIAYLTGGGPADDLQTSVEQSWQIPTEAAEKRTMSPKRSVTLLLSVFGHLCLLSMLGGAVVVMVGINSMTPETLPPYDTGDAAFVNFLQSAATW